MIPWWSALQRWRDQRVLNKRPIPEPLWQQTLSKYPFLHMPDADEAARLRTLSTLFLGRKQFHGAGGLVVTDPMAVAIAAQACLPVLNLGLGLYDAFVGIVVHPAEVVAPREVQEDDGVVHGYEETLAGEAMDGGPVTLSWQDVEGAAETAVVGYNVVVHEFAHVIDMNDGAPNGRPALPPGELDRRWQRVFEGGYKRFCAEVDSGRDTALDPYAAEAPEEFFAVACEAFFVAPHILLDEHADVYDLLKAFFRQDPATRMQRPVPAA